MRANTIVTITRRLVRTGNGCWIWIGRTERGYGRVNYRGSRIRVHRLVYEHMVGPIPEGLTLDHLCRVRACANPEHLEPVDPVTNAGRGNSPPALNSRKTHCVRGHPLTGEHLTNHPDGRRRCKTCTNNGRRDRNREYMRRYRSEGHEVRR